MIDTDPPNALAKQRRALHVRICYWGAAILLVGLGGAALLYVFAADNGGAEPTDEIASDKIHQSFIKGVGGRAAVHAVRLDQWLAGLFHGRALAYTVAALAVAIALVCFWVARMLYVSSRSGQTDREG